MLKKLSARNRGILTRYRSTSDAGLLFTPTQLSGLQLWLDPRVGSGTSWPDQSGIGNNATLNNGPSFTTNAAGKPCVRFDGSNDYGITASNLGMSGNTAFSIAIWVTMLESGAAAICGWGNTGGFTAAGLWSSLASAGRISAEYGSGNGAYSGTTKAANVRFMMVYTKAVGAIAANSKIYFDGNDAGSITGSSNTPNVTNSQFYVGQWGNYTGDPSAWGNFDCEHVMVFNRVLTAGEVTSLYNWYP